MPQATDGRKVKVFISYSRQDMVAADRLVAALEGAGFPVTIDRRDLPYGEEWQKELQGFMQACDSVVWLITPRSVASRWCNWELGEVAQLGKRLVPVKLTEIDTAALPPAIGKIHILPAEGVFDLERHLPVLIETLEADRAWIKHGTRLGDQAAQWRLKDMDRALLLRGRALRDAEQWSAAKPPAAPTPTAQVLDFILASRKAASVSLRRWAILAVIGAASASILATWSVIQWRRAETTLEAATRSAIDLVGHVARDLRHVSGVRSEQIKTILEAIQSLQRDLTSAGRITPALQESEARAAIELAETLTDQEDDAGSAAAAEKAVRIEEGLVAASKPNVWAQQNLYYAYRVLGSSLMRLGRMEEARTAFAQSLQICQRRLAAEPSSIKWKEEVGVGYTKIGEVEFMGERSEEALAAFQTSLNYAKEVTASGPDNEQFIFDEAASRNNVARMLFFLDRINEAREAYAGVAAGFEGLVKRQPDNTRWRSGLAQAYSNIADLESEADDGPAAIATYLKAREQWGALVAADPSNLSWHGSLASVEANLGNLGNSPRQRYQAARDILNRLKEVGRLTSESKALLSLVEARLAKLPP